MGKAARQKRQRRAATAVAPPPPSRTRAVGAIAAVGVAALAGGVVLYLVAGNDEPAQPAAPSAAATAALGMQEGPAPWIAEQDQLPARLQKIGIPFSNMEGTAVHIHPTLKVYVDGEPVEVPTDIGISYAEQSMAALHTHDTEGTIHVESAVVRDYTLGQFFDTWGVRLSSACVGGYCAGGGKQLKAFVDGKAASTPRRITLVDGQQIVVAYGTPRDVAKAVG